MADQRSALLRFVGFDRIVALLRALRAQSAEAPQKSLSVLHIALALIIGALPLLGFFLRKFADVDTVTVSVGIAALLSLFFIRVTGVSIDRIADWRKALSLTHTAFALGCIPAAVIVVMFPEGLYHVNNYTMGGGGGAAPSISSVILFALEVSLWAAVTEEIIFRGLIISVLRRCRIFGAQGRADLFAVFVSSALFAVTHALNWGVPIGIAIFGLGLGLGAAFLAVRERLLPVIVYHAIFDFLSLMAAFLIR